MGTEGEAGVDLDSPGTGSGPAAVGMDLDDPARVGTEVALLDASQSLVPLSWFRSCCPSARTWYLDPVPSPAALKNPSCWILSGLS